MKKGKIINLEWMCDYNYFDDETFNPIKLKLIKKDIDEAVAEGCNTILGLYFLDGFLPINNKKVFIDHLQEVKDYAASVGITDLRIVSGHGEDFEGLPVQHYFFDNVFRLVYNVYRDLIDHLPQSWDTTKSKALLLGGMPDRCNRIGLLARFYDEGMVGKDIEWSFYPPWAPLDQQWCREYMKENFPDWTDKKYEKFLKNCDKRFDDRYLTCMSWYGNFTTEEFDEPWYAVRETDWVKNPTWIDPIVYENCLFDVVSEGPNYWGTGNYQFLTEKLWRPILCKRPFILAGWPGQWKYLEQLGYKTFKEYLPIPDYGLIEDDEERMAAIVTNTKYLLEHREHDDKIANDVEYNYQLSLKRNKEQEQMWLHWHKDLGIKWEEIEHYLIKRLGYTDLIMNLPQEYLPQRIQDRERTGGSAT